MKKVREIIASREVKAIAVYGVLFALGVWVFGLWVYPGLIVEEHLLNHDARHYFTIREEGYEGFLCAFFPLFPLVWKLLGVGTFAMSCINALIYFSSLIFLLRALRVKFPEMLLYLSIPSAIFFYLPYSEAFFFASGTLLILGIRKGRRYWVLAAILLCTLTRPAYTVLLPALVLMEVLSGNSNRQVFINCLLYIFSALLGTLLVGLIQYADHTGRWFEFFGVQKLWGNFLQFPQLPLRFWGGEMIGRLDGTALLFGLSAGLVLLRHLLPGKYAPQTQLPKEVVLSLAYLGGISLTVLLFRGGSLFSLNRFVFAVPFIIVAINYYLQRPFSFSRRQLLGALLLLLCYWTLFGACLHLSLWLKYSVFSLYLLLFLLIKAQNRQVALAAMSIFTGINFLIQLFFYLRFLEEGNTGWIG